jgi:circadian clock protein KaiC
MPLATGIPGLDSVLGGGLPEYSFNLITGGPGTGKTTLAQQITFANATSDARAVYFTVLGEPTIKMLRYQQAMAFFDPEKVGNAIRFVNLSGQVLQRDLSSVLESIRAIVREVAPRIVVVDSFRTIVRAAGTPASGELEIQSFVQRLALDLTSWQATTFLVGEYNEREMSDNPIFTVADGILWLSQGVERNSVVRKLQVVKMRGQAPMPGLHTFRISDEGIRIFPRIQRQPSVLARRPVRERLPTGVPGLDAMLGGGIPAGDSVLVAGPSGSGKTIFATQFVAAGDTRNEPGVIAVFEEHPHEYLARARLLGYDLESMIQEGKLRVLYLHPLDLSVDEALTEIQDAVEAVQARRVVIDSLSGFELALAPTFREDFRESLYRMVGALTGRGITVLMTAEIIEAFTDLRFSPHAVSFLSDDIILQRYIELNGRIEKVLAVVKMRSSDHEKDLRLYEITSHGLVVGSGLREYRGIITGVPALRTAHSERRAGLTEREELVLETLIAHAEATPENLAQATGLRRAAVLADLRRLVQLGYITRTAGSDTAVYRPSLPGMH